MQMFWKFCYSGPSTFQHLSGVFLHDIILHIFKDPFDVVCVSGTSEVAETAISYLRRNSSHEHVMYKSLSTEVVSFRAYTKTIL